MTMFLWIWFFTVNGWAKSIEKTDQDLLIIYESDLKKIHHLIDQKKNSEALSWSLKQEALSVLSNIADIQFRTLNAPYQNANKKLVNQKSYNKTLEEIITTTNDLIRLKNEPDLIPKYYLIQGKAYEDLKNKMQAIKSYEQVILHYSHTSYALIAGLYLHRVNDSLQRYTEDLSVLLKVKADIHDPQYSSFLHALALDYFYLKNYRSAISLLKNEINILHDLSSLDAIQKSQLEQAYEYWTLNYFQASLVSPAEYSIENYLKQVFLIVRSEFISKQIKSMINLLRSKDQYQNLKKIKFSIQDLKIDACSKLMLLTMILDYEYDRKIFSQIDKTIFSLKPYVIKAIEKNFTKDDNYMNAKSKIIFISKDFSKNINNNNLLNTEKFQAVQNALTKMATLLSSDGLTTAEESFNIAENLLSQKKYRYAVEKYTSILNDFKKMDPLLEQKVRLRKVVAYYGLLIEEKLIPQQLSFSQPFDKSAPQRIQEWVQLVDSVMKIISNNQEMQLYVFEYYRLSYLYQLKSVDFLEEYIQNNPHSTFVSVAISIIIDSYIAEKKWALVSQKAKEYLKKYSLSNDFKKKLIKLSQESSVKKVEVSFLSKDYEGVIKNGMRILKLPPQKLVPIYANALKLSIEACLQKKDFKMAEGFLFFLIEHFSDSSELDYSIESFLEEIEKEYNYKKAFDVSLKYVSVSSKKNNNKKNIKMQEKLLFYASLVSIKSLQTATQLACNLKAPTKSCLKYYFFIDIFSSQDTKINYPKEFIDVKNFINARYINLKDFSEKILSLCASYGLLDGDIQIILLNNIIKKLKSLYQDLLRRLPEEFPISLDQKKLMNRSQAIGLLQKTFEKLAQFPWLTIKVYSFAFQSKLLEFYAQEIANIPPPIGTTDVKEFKKILDNVQNPILKASQDLLKAFQENAAENGLEIFEINEYFSFKPLNPYLSAIQPKSFWNVLKHQSIEETWLKKFQLGFLQKNFRLMMALILFATEKKNLNASDISIARATLFSLVGAQPEALAELTKQASDEAASLKSLALSASTCYALPKKKCAESFKAFLENARVNTVRIFSSPLMYKLIQALGEVSELKSDSNESSILKDLQ